MWRDSKQTFTRGYVFSCEIRMSPTRRFADPALSTGHLIAQAKLNQISTQISELLHAHWGAL